MKSKLYYWTLIFVLGLPVLLSAQGMTRSSGLGFRVNFWNITNRPTTVSVSSNNQTANVDVSGAGGTIYFFSRVHNNLFFETNFEAVASVQTIANGNTASDSTKVNVVIPILFGMRYDILPSHLTTSLLPYVTIGAGPYWSQKGNVESDAMDANAQQEFKSEFFYGAYVGIGTNILFTDWLALNLDFKYHMPELNVNHQYSGLDFGLGLSAMWGKKRELFQLQDIRVIVTDIYPAYYQFYNTYPIALVSVKNIAGHPIEVNVKSNIENFSKRPNASGFIEIQQGETADIPVTALFGQRVLEASRNKPAVLDIEIEGRAGRSSTRQYSAQLIVHSRNSWNGDMDKLVYFVTPENETILSMTRNLVGANLDSIGSNLKVFSKAQMVFDALTEQGVRYHPDPNIPFYQDDRVQFALETLQIGSGDCDDLTVLYASCLESLGIKTAFVEVRDPEKDLAHLYLLFDSGLPANQGSAITTNDKKYIIRARRGSQKTVWIPVETTLISKGFESAWRSGAIAYLEEGLHRGGLASGWVRVIDVQ